MSVYRIVLHVRPPKMRDHEFFIAADTPDAALAEAINELAYAEDVPETWVGITRGPEPPRRRRTDPKESAQP